MQIANFIKAVWIINLVLKTKAFINKETKFLIVKVLLIKIEVLRALTIREGNVIQAYIITEKHNMANHNSKKFIQLILVKE